MTEPDSIQDRARRHLQQMPDPLSAEGRAPAPELARRAVKAAEKKPRPKPKEADGKNG